MIDHDMRALVALGEGKAALFKAAHERLRVVRARPARLQCLFEPARVDALALGGEAIGQGHGGT
jgi:hypothetical protein